MTLKFSKLTFKGGTTRTFPGTHGLIVADSPSLSASRTIYAGVAGQTEVRVATAGRHLSVQYLLHKNYTTLVQIENDILLMHRAIGAHGQLWTAKTNAWEEQSIIYRYVTFDGFEMQPMNGQRNACVLKDVAGGIDGGWFAYGRLHFWQMRF